MTHLWIDASAGIAGDMLLGALVDAGADLGVIRAAVEAVVPGAVRIEATEVRRAGLRAVKVDVEPLITDPSHRSWRDIRGMLDTSAAPARAFAELAGAEGHVHGVAADEVRFHEVGALDSIADVVGVCAALDDLGVTSLSAGEVAVGSGRIRTAHGELPVPAPAVAELARGWRIRAGGPGELATPTGLAVLRALATCCEDLPSMTVRAIGVGAGSRDTPGRPNVVRAFLGAVTASPATTPAVILEANVDDLDPRLWPGVLAGLMDAGASDAWLTPILMKKGRPAHTLTVLCPPDLADELRSRVFAETSTLGVRSSTRQKTVLARMFVPVPVGGATVAVKVGHADGRIVQAMPEFADVADLARRSGRPERAVLADAVAAAAAAGLIAGAPSPRRPPGRLSERTGGPVPETGATGPEAS